MSRPFRTLLIASTIAVVLCYAWLTSRLMEPQFSTPDFISETFVRTTEGRLFLFDERARQFPRESSRLQTELETLNPLLNWIGSLERPIEVLVDEKDAERLLVTDSRVEIGRDILLARGQLMKSVLKSWLLQRASPAVTSSQLRIEVASDVLLAMLTGRLSLGVPNRDDEITFDDGRKPWFSYADSYRGVCEGEWRLIELAPLCPSAHDGSVSSLSFRPFLGAQIWRSYSALSLGERLPFIRKWVSVLRASRSAVVPSLKEGWRAVVAGELETLFPSELDPLSRDRSAWPSAVEVPLLVVGEKGDLQAPGTLRVLSPELPIARARMALMPECAPPTIADVVSIAVPVERVVWKPGCAQRKSDFIQVRPSALRLALSRGLTSRDVKLDDFVLKNAQASWMGLADAKWDSRLNAYQVRGAIQAVELFRLGTRDTSSGATTSAAPISVE